MDYLLDYKSEKKWEGLALRLGPILDAWAAG